MRIEFNYFDMEAASLVCPEEKKEFKEALNWLRRTVWNLNAVENGRWAKGDIDAVVTAENISMSTEELKELRIKNLEHDKEKALDLSVKKFNKMNRIYNERTGHYICGFYENRDLLMRHAMLRLATA